MLGKLKQLKSLGYIIQALLVLAVPVLMIGQSQAVSILGQRRVSISSPVAGATVTHTISFVINTPATLGSIQLQYCDNDPFVGTACTAPPGLNLTGATLSSQTGEIGFSIDPSSTANNILLTRVPVASLAGPVQYVFNNVINPTTLNNSTYVRMSTYVSNNGSGARTDQGGAVFVTAGSFGTAAYVPPFLLFCAAVTITGNCQNINGSNLDFGYLEPTHVSSVNSQSAAATNDPTGYIIYSLGTTMTSGNNTIPALTIPNPSIAGINQFGINLRKNNNPNNGQDISGAGSGAVRPNYNTPDLYMFSPGSAIAEATLATDYNIYTTTYIVNISLDQAPGVYATTITYMAVAQF